MNRIFLFLLLTLLSTAQDTLILGKDLKVSLKANQPRTITLLINQTTHNNTDLLIVADPLLEIPNQIPDIQINSNGTSLSCFTASNEMEGLCRIQSSSVQKQMQVILECVEDCVFWLSSYFNNVYTIQLDNQISIYHDTVGLAVYEFQMKVPQQKFDQLIISLSFNKDNQQQNGAEMFINFGNASIAMPDQKSYKIKAAPMHRALMASLPSSDLLSDSFIKIAVFTTTIGSMRLQANIRKEGVESLSLGGQRHDILGHGLNKIYKFDSSDYYQELDTYNLDIAVSIFSGHPEVSVAFDSSFNQTFQNNGVAGMLNYLLTPQLRKQYKFVGIVYIKVHSFNYESAFELSVRVAAKEYIYMKQASNYLSYISKQNLQNYIFDYEYDTASTTADSFVLHFTVKIQMLKGAAYYFSRLCNKQNNKDCLITADKINDPEYMREVDALQGQILHYYSVYEIFQWCKLSDCKKEQLNNATNRYHCKFHIVGYNPDVEQLNWALTIYSRVKNIELAQSVPFKDKVYEDSYNYYVFAPPTDEYDEINIFLTLLTGEAEIISSLKYDQPENVFNYFDPSLKFGISNQITYKAAQAKGKIYIGVYGDTMAEYLLHVVITRSKKESPLLLMPQIAQMFRLSTDRQKMQFGLTPNSKGQWVVEVDAVQGDIYYVLTGGKERSIICNSSVSGDNSCQFVGEVSHLYVLTVFRASKGESKVVISYSPAGKCKILPLNSPNFIQISPNHTKCLEYIIHSTPLLVAYSKNILSTFDNNFTLNLFIKDQQVKSSKMHYHFINKETVQSFCAKSAEINNDVCRLRIEINSMSQLDLQITVAAVGGEIPLYSGIVLPFNKEDLQAGTPLYFYYQVTQDNKLQLNIKSFTFDQYAIEWKLVQQLTYLNNSNSQVYPLVGHGDGKTASITEYHRNVGIKIDPKTNKCENCMLLVAIYPTNKIRYSVLQLQIISREIELGLGETRKGIITTQQTVTYKLANIPKLGAVLSLVGFESSDCYSANLKKTKYHSYQQSITASETIVDDDYDYEVELLGTSDKECDYEISLWSSNYPIRVINSYGTYSIELKDSGAFYFLYQHTTNTSFKIYEIITSGSLYSYAAPLIDTTLQLFLEKQQYVFGSASPFEDLWIDSSSKQFCYNCIYLIKVIGNPSASISIGVSDSHNPVFLENKGIVRQKIEKNEVSYYQYYSYDDFTIRLNIVSGALEVKVKDLNDKVIYSQLLTTDKQIDIKPAEVEYFYLVEVTAQQTSTYILQIVSQEGVRLIEGVPYQYQLVNSTQFLYTHSTNESINLVVISEQTEKNQQLSGLEVTVNLTTTKDRKKEVRAVAVRQTERSGNIVSFELSGQTGLYSIVIVSSKVVSAKVLITRNQLTYLPVQTELIGKGLNIYELSTSSRNIMMELFVCKGAVKIEATNVYAQFEKTSKNSDSEVVVTLQHNNMAGHYVIGSQSKDSEYYVMVNGTKESVYRLSFDYIGEDLPYKSFLSVDSSVQYTLKNSSVVLDFAVPQPKDNKRSAGITAQYEVAYSLTYSDLKVYQQCLTSTGSLALVKRNVDNFPSTSNQHQFYSISREQISKFWKQDIKTFFIAVKVIISMKVNGETKLLKYLYQPLEIRMQAFEVDAAKQQEKTAYKVILWILFPLLIAGLILFFAIRFCWRYWHIFRSKMYILQQEEVKQEHGPSFEVMQGKKNSVQT